MVMWTMFGANIFIALYIMVGGGDFVNAMLIGSGLNKWVVIWIMMIIVIFLGCFVDWVGILMLSIPLFGPIIRKLGFDPIWFGVLMAVTASFFPLLGVRPLRGRFFDSTEDRLGAAPVAVVSYEYWKRELLGDSIRYFKPNTKVVALTHEGNIVSLELPKVVELKVTETTPMTKGATVTNQMKDAELETGLKVRVPPFIEIGVLGW